MQMHGVTDPNHQLIAVGWEEGTLRCRWRKGEGEHTGVPEDLFLKLRRVPFAYRQYKATIQWKFPYTKIEDPPEEQNGQLERQGTDLASGGAVPSVEDSRNRRGYERDTGRQDRQSIPAESRRVMDFYRAEDGLTFTEEGHRYHLQGKPLISLTQILSASGLVDYSAVSPDVLSNKAEFGTKVHEYTAWHDKDDLEPDDWEKLLAHPKYGPRLKGWVQFREDFNFTPDQNWIEEPCAVTEYGITYAMTLDRFGMFVTSEESVTVKRTLGVVEIKTCCDAEPSHQIQTAGQAVVFDGNGTIPCRRVAVYLLDKPNGAGKLYKAIEHTDRLDRKIFAACLVLTQFRINNKLLKG